MSTAKTNAKSPTPVLDLLKPFPRQDTEPITGRGLVGLTTFFVIPILTREPSFLIIPAGLLLLIVLGTAIHELGHLLAGWCVGLRFVAVTICFFTVRLDAGRFKFTLRPRLFGGMAYMSLNRIRRVRHRLAIFVAGGPLASLLSGALAIAAGHWLNFWPDSPFAAFFYILGGWSLFIGYLACFPHLSRGLASDGMLIRRLLFSRIESTQIIASYALSAIDVSNPIPQDYFQRWFHLAGTRTNLQAANPAGDWLAYKNNENREVAAQSLEKCLASCAYTNSRYREHLITEAIFFSAYHKKDPVKADAWAKRRTRAEESNPLSEIRLAAALAVARKNRSGAIGQIERGLSLLRQFPASPSRQRYETSWAAWLEQMQKDSA